MSKGLVGDKPCDLDAILTTGGDRLPGSHQRPTWRIFKCEIKIRKYRAGIGVPGTSGTHVNYLAPAIKHHRPRVTDGQLCRALLLQRHRQNNGDEIIAPPRQIATVNGLVLNKLHRLIVEFDLSDFQIA